MLVGSFSSRELIYKCAKCKRATLLTLPEWHRLPDATDEEVKKKL